MADVRHADPEIPDEQARPNKGDENQSKERAVRIMKPVIIGAGALLMLLFKRGRQ